ncbi:hypothetical protein V8D89_003343 [Ganoderma adspersum]
MASYLPSCEPPQGRDQRQSVIFLGPLPAQYPSSTVSHIDTWPRRELRLTDAAAFVQAHVSRSQPQYYGGRGELAKLCANWMKGVFCCPDIPEPPETDPTLRPKPLDEFIAYIFRRVNADPAVTFCALYTLNRLKEAKPNLITTSGHALFFAAFLVAGKVLSDASYSNKDMAGITQGMFPPRVVNQMERKILEQLEWVVRPPDVETAKEFEEQVRKHYTAGPRPWLGPSRRQPASTTPVATNAPQNDRYPVQPPRAANNPAHPSSQLQHAYPPATARPQPRVNTAMPAASSASHSSRPRPTHHDRHHNPNPPHNPPPLIHTVYESDSSAAPSPVTPEDYEDLRARTRTTGSRPRRPGVMLLGPSYVLVGSDPSKFGSAEGEPRMVRARDFYATARP